MSHAKSYLEIHNIYEWIKAKDANLITSGLMMQSALVMNKESMIALIQPMVSIIVILKLNVLLYFALQEVLKILSLKLNLDIQFIPLLEFSLFITNRLIKLFAMMASHNKVQKQLVQSYMATEMQYLFLEVKLVHIKNFGLMMFLAQEGKVAYMIVLILNMVLIIAIGKQNAFKFSVREVVLSQILLHH